MSGLQCGATVSILCQETVPGHGPSGMDCIVIMVMMIMLMITSGMDCIVIMVMMIMLMMMMMMMTAVWSHSVHTLPRDCIWTWSVRYGLYSYHGDDDDVDDDDDDDDCSVEPQCPYSAKRLYLDMVRQVWTV